MDNYCVYKHTTPSGKVYIGITSQTPQKRWNKGRGYLKNEYFNRAIKKYGWELIQHEIIATGLSREAACKEEKKLIALYKSNDSAFGYNITAGGDHYQHTEETKRKISEGHKNPSAETRAKIGAASRGRHPSTETLEKMRTAQLGKKHSENAKKKISEANKGRHLSDESRAKISINRMGKGTGARSEETKARMRENHGGGAKPAAVRCIDTNNSFNSIKEAARWANVPPRSISCCCRHIPHYNTAAGYHWEFVGEQLRNEG